MASDNSVEFEIVAQVDQAIRSIKSLEDNATKSVEAISSSFANLKTIATSAFAFLGGREIFRFFQDSIKEAEESDAAVSQLTVTLKSLGQFTPALVKDFEDFSTQLQKNSTFSDESVLSLLAQAKQMGLTDSKAKQLVQTSADLASITHEELPTAFEDLSRSLLGNVRSLALVDPVLKKFTKSQLEAGAAIDYLSEKLRGDAAATLQTYQGAIAQNTLGFKDLQEEIGKTITQNPVVIAAIKQSSLTFISLSEKIQDNSVLISDFISLTVKLSREALPPLVTVLKVVTNGFATLIIGGAKATEVLSGLLSAFLAFAPVADIFGALASVVVAPFSAIVTISSSVLTALSAVVDAANSLPGVGDSFKSLSKNLDSAKAKIDSAADSLTGLIGKDYSKSFAAASKGFDSLQKDAKAFGDNAFDATISVNKGFDALSNTIEEATKLIKDSDSETVKAAKQAADAQELAGQAAKRAAVEAAAAAAKAQEERAKAQEALKKETEEAKKLLESLTTKSLDESGKIAEEREKNRAAVEKFYKDGVIDATQAGQARIQLESIATTKFIELNKKTRDQVNQFKDQLFAKDTYVLDKVNLERQANLEKLKKFEDEGSVSVEEAEALRLAIIRDSSEKANEIRQKAIDDFKKVISDAAANPFTILFPKIEIDPQSLKDFKETGSQVASGIGATLEILKGSKGAEGLFKSAGSAIGDALLPGIGGAVGELTTILGQGPDTVKKLIKEFVAAIPTLLTNIADAIPALITGLIEAIPEIVSALVKEFTTANGAAKIGKAIAEVWLIFASPIGAAMAAAFEAVSGPIGAAMGAAFAVIAEPVGAAIAAAFAAASPIITAALAAAAVSLPVTLAVIAAAAIALIAKRYGAQIAEASKTFSLQISDSIKSAGGIVTDKFKAVIAGISSVLNPIFSSISTFFEPAIDKLKLVFGNFGDNFKQTVLDSAKFLKDAFLSPLSDSLSGIGASLQSFLRSFGDAIINMGGILAEAFTSGAAKLLQALSGAADAFLKLVKPVADLFSPLFDKLGGFLTSIGKLIGDIGSKIGDGITKAFTGAEDILAKAFDKLFSGLNSVYQKLEAAFNNPLKAIRDLFGELGDAIKSPFQDIIDFFKNFKIELPGSSSGGVVGKVVSGIKSITGKFASGGLVPNGFPNDSFPARLTSGELIIPKDLVSGLSGVIKRDEAASNSKGNVDINTALLSKMVALLSEPMQVSTTAEVDGRALANIILQLSRNNARLTA